MSSEQGNYPRNSREERRRRELMHRSSRRNLFSMTKPFGRADTNRVDPRSHSVQRRTAHQRTRMKDWRGINKNCMKLIEDCQGIIERLQTSTSYPSCDNVLNSGSGAVNHSNLIPISTNTQPQIRFEDMMERLGRNEHYQPPHLTSQTIERLISSSQSASSSLCPLQFIEVSLVCPLSKTKIKLPIRGKHCKHLGCCDAATFLSLVGEKPPSRWKCPICSLPMPYEDIKVDGFLSDIIKREKEGALKIEFTSSTKWRVKAETGALLNSRTVNSSTEIIDLTCSPQSKSVVIDLTDSP